MAGGGVSRLHWRRVVFTALRPFGAVQALAGQNPDNIILFIAFYADRTMIEVWVCFLITPFHRSGCQFADGFLGCISKSTLVPVPGICVPDLLNEAEYKPGWRNNHQSNKGYWHEDERATAEVLWRHATSDSYCHLYRDVFLQITQNIFTPQFCNHDSDNISSACNVK